MTEEDDEQAAIYSDPDNLRPAGKGRRVREPWVTSHVVAEHLGITTEYLYANLERLGIPAVKIGRRWRFRISEVDAWLESQMKGQGQ